MPLRSTIRRSALPVLLLSVLACDGDASGPDLPGEPASLTLSADTVRLAAIGAAERLTATVSDASGVALGDASVSWSSDDESVATVDGSGRVQAVGAGEARVTALAGAASDTASVVVTQIAASVAVSPALGPLRAIGDSIRFDATVRDANGYVLPDAVVEWSIADTAVAGVHTDGWVTARSNGATTVEARADGTADQAAVAVEQVVASVEVSPASATLPEGGIAALEATVADSNGVQITDAHVGWTTSDPTTATVDAAGRVTAVRGDASATITAASGPASASAEIAVLGRIVFRSTRDGDSELYVMNTDGSDPTRLTYGAEHDAYPAWSPDGERIAFSSTRFGDSELFVMDADGSTVQRLTETAGPDVEPAWSPDGGRIAFRTRRDGDDEIYVMSADGSLAVNITDAPLSSESDPAWSPDGTLIAFRTHRDDNGEIYVMEPDGTTPVNLTEHEAFDSDPVWSPDGSRIAFVSNRDDDLEIYVMNADGSGQTNLTNHAGSDFEPTWSPDGSRIAFVSGRDGSPEIYVMDADGDGDPVRLTTQPDADQYPDWRSRP